MCFVGADIDRGAWGLRGRAARPAAAPLPARAAVSSNPLGGDRDAEDFGGGRKSAGELTGQSRQHPSDGTPARVSPPPTAPYGDVADHSGDPPHSRPQGRFFCPLFVFHSSHFYWGLYEATVTRLCGVGGG